MSEEKSLKPWFKQMWPWLLISGPAVAIIGCAITIWLAAYMYTDTPLHGDVVQHGLKVEQVSK